MSKTNDEIEFTSVPIEIHKAFLKELEKKEISTDLIDRLKSVLIELKDPTEKNIKQAIFPED
jgi:hypothetical protein